MRFYDTWASFKALDAPKTPIEMFSPIDYAVHTTIANDLSLEGTYDSAFEDGASRRANRSAGAFEESDGGRSEARKRAAARLFSE